MAYDLTSESNLGQFLHRLNRRLKLGELFSGQINFAKHPVSRTEFLGTLFHLGFDLVKEKKHFFTLKKISSPGPLSEISRSKKLIFKQPRVGLGGKLIKVFKLRTMYPMAHKAQEYIFKKKKPGLYGKILDDFRITPYGRFLRRFWIDELPQIINILKGEMKLVGLRPLTPDFFKTLPSALQQERLKHLPALMAAIYADRPKNLTERFQSEMRFLARHKKHPLLTDLIYFFKILWQIIIAGQRGH